MLCRLKKRLLYFNESSENNGDLKNEFKLEYGINIEKKINWRLLYEIEQAGLIRFVYHLYSKFDNKDIEVRRIFFIRWDNFVTKLFREHRIENKKRKLINWYRFNKDKDYINALKTLKYVFWAY